MIDLEFMKPDIATATPGVLASPNPDAPAAREASVIAEAGVRTNNEANSQGPEAATATKQPKLDRMELQVAKDMIKRLEQEVRSGNTGKAVLDLLASYKNIVNPSQESPITSAKPVQVRGGSRTIGTDDRTGESDNPEGLAVGTARGSGESEGASGKPLSAEEQERQAGGNPAANASRELTEKSQIKKERTYIPLGFLPFWALYRGYRWLSPKTGIPKLVRGARKGAHSLAEFVGRSYAEGARLKEEQAARKQAVSMATAAAQPVQETAQPAADTVSSTAARPDTTVANLAQNQPAKSQNQDLRAKALEEISSYEVGIKDSDIPGNVIQRINGVITERNKQPGNAYKAPWEIDKEETLDYVKGAIELVGEKSQPTVQQKT